MDDFEAVIRQPSRSWGGSCQPSSWDALPPRLAAAVSPHRHSLNLIDASRTALSQRTSTLFARSSLFRVQGREDLAKLCAILLLGQIFCPLKPRPDPAKFSSELASCRCRYIPSSYSSISFVLEEFTKYFITRMNVPVAMHLQHAWVLPSILLYFSRPENMRFSLSKYRGVVRLQNAKKQLAE